MSSDKNLAFESFYDAAQYLEEILIKEEGHRQIKGGVKVLYSRDCSGQLYDCASAIYDKKCACVALLVGSTSNMIMWPPTDTDGPGGCFALANTLIQMDKKVIIVCDDVNDGQVKPAMEKSDVFKFCQRMKMEDKLVYESFADYRKWKDGIEEERLRDIFKECSHIINCGRPGPAEDEHYYSFDKRQMTHYQPNFVKLFRMAEDSRGSDHLVQTTCIGELGNELGMGQLRNRVEANVPEGKLIACDVKADNVIVATTVNWGCYGLCAMLAIVAVVSNKGPKNLFIDDFYPNRQEQALILKCLVDEASRCGVTGTRDQMIDKYPASKIWEVMEHIRNEAREISIKMGGDSRSKLITNKGHEFTKLESYIKTVGNEATDETSGKVPVNGEAEEIEAKVPQIGAAAETNVKVLATEETSGKVLATEETNVKVLATEETNGKVPATEETNGKVPATEERKNGVDAKPSSIKA